MTRLYAQYDHVPDDELEVYLFNEMRFKMLPGKARKRKLCALKRKVFRWAYKKTLVHGVGGLILVMMYTLGPICVIIAAIIGIMHNAEINKEVSNKFKITRTCVAELRRGTVENAYKYCALKTIAELNGIQRYMFSGERYE